MNFTNDQKWLISAALTDKIDQWEVDKKQAENYPSLYRQFDRQIKEAEAIIEKLDEEVEE